MFGFFKNLLRRQANSVAEHLPAENDIEVVDTTALHNTPSHRPPSHHVVPQRKTPSQNGTGIELPLEPILRALPLELQPRLRQSDVGDATIYIPLEKILAQLSRGVVNISFGELRQAAPELFHPGHDRDRTLVPLPLSEILQRLNPALITRRRAQRSVEIPAEISSPFQSRGHGLSFTFTQAPKAEPEAAPLEEATEQEAPLFIPGLTPRNPVSPVATPRPPATPSSPAPTLGSRSIPFNPNPKASVSAPPKPAKPVAAPVQPKPAGPPPLIVGLSALAEGWSDAVRQEIVQLNLVDAKIGLPAEAVERALKQGRIAFTWKMLRSWIRPATPPSVSAHDGAVLELPLKVVAPLFIARQAEAAKSQPKINIDENIPNLFFGFPQPAPAPATGPQSSQLTDTNYYVWDDSSDTVVVDESSVKRTTPGTGFVTRYATPNEIVSRAASLEGVAGALIALPDGLMVASRLSGEMNAETIAAFLPQIFGKVSQCTKELRMGDLNNLNFTVGNTPWKIFRVNAIFFAALGFEGAPLPTAQLAALAAELDHKPK